MSAPRLVHQSTTDKVPKLEVARDTVLVASHVKVRGVKYRRLAQEDEKLGESLRTVRTGERTFAHEQAYKTAKTLADRAIGIVRRATVATVLGKVTDSARASQMNADLNVCAQEIAAWNASARTGQLTNGAPHPHTVVCEVLALPLGMSTDGASDALAEALAEALSTLKDASTSGDPLKLRAALQRHRNADVLVSGVMRDMVRGALACCVEAQRLTNKRLKGGESGDSIARTPPSTAEIDGAMAALKSYAPDVDFTLHE